MGIRAILMQTRARACAAVWAVLALLVLPAAANVRPNLGDLPTGNRVGGFSATFENGTGPDTAFVQYPRLENEPILAMTASGRLFWLSRDPLGELADPLHNLYRFVGNNPLNYVDADGLQAVQNRIDFYMPGWGESQSYEMVGLNSRRLSLGNIDIYRRAAEVLAGAGIAGDLQTLVDPDAGAFWRIFAAASIMADTTYLGEIIPNSKAMRCVAKAAKSGGPAVPRQGATIYRVFGGESPGLGRSWSTVAPDAVSDFRASAGLFEGNTGQYVIQARLRPLENASVRSAIPGPTTPPNALQVPELLFNKPPVPGVDIDIIGVGGANPGF